MSRLIKGMVTDSVRDCYAGVESACVVDITGMTVKEQESLRTSLRSKSAKLQVVRNSLTRRALKGTPLEPLAASMVGPCALVTSSESLIDTAKILVDAAKEFTELSLKDAIFDGDTELLTVEQMAKMKGRLELLGEVAMLVASPGRALAGCISSPQSKIAGCLKAIVDKAA